MNKDYKAIKSILAEQKKMKIAVGIMIAVLLCLSAVVYNITGVDARFIRDMGRGLDASLALENGEGELQDLSKKNSTEFIDIEYEAVSKYRKAAFRKKKLGELAVQYLDALEECREVASNYDPEENYGLFWNAFSQTYGKRLTAIYMINSGDYGLDLEYSDHRDKAADLLAQGWILSKVGDIEFTRSVKKDGTVVFTDKLVNDSGLDIGYIDLEVELYNSEGVVVETASAYAEGIKNGDEFTLEFFRVGNSDAEQFRIVSAICRAKTADDINGEEETDEEIQ